MDNAWAIDLSEGIMKNKSGETVNMEPRVRSGVAVIASEDVKIKARHEHDVLVKLDQKGDQPKDGTRGMVEEHPRLYQKTNLMMAGNLTTFHDGVCMVRVLNSQYANRRIKKGAVLGYWTPEGPDLQTISSVHEVGVKNDHTRKEETEIEKEATTPAAANGPTVASVGETARRVNSEAVKKSLQKLFNIHGLMLEVEVDQGTPFVSADTASFLKKKGVRLVILPAYVHQTKGKLERAHHTLEAIIRSLTAQRGGRWQNHVQ
eukprot:tig00020801_g13885.t1